jgi:hypothetical protein
VYRYRRRRGGRGGTMRKAPVASVSRRCQKAGGRRQEEAAGQCGGDTLTLIMNPVWSKAVVGTLSNALAMRSIPL